MFIPKWLLNSILDNQRDMERRIKRLELIALNDAENKIKSLSDKEAGATYKDGVNNIEKEIERRFVTVEKRWRYI